MFVWTWLRGPSSEIPAHHPSLSPSRFAQVRRRKEKVSPVMPTRESMDGPGWRVVRGSYSGYTLIVAGATCIYDLPNPCISLSNIPPQSASTSRSFFTVAHRVCIPEPHIRSSWAAGSLTSTMRPKTRTSTQRPSRWRADSRLRRQRRGLMGLWSTSTDIRTAILSCPMARAM